MAVTRVTVSQRARITVLNMPAMAWISPNMSNASHVARQAGHVWPRSEFIKSKACLGKRNVGASSSSSLRAWLAPSKNVESVAYLVWVGWWMFPRYSWVEWHTWQNEIHMGICGGVARFTACSLTNRAPGGDLHHAGDSYYEGNIPTRHVPESEWANLCAIKSSNISWQ